MRSGTWPSGWTGHHVSAAPTAVWNRWPAKRPSCGPPDSPCGPPPRWGGQATVGRIVQAAEAGHSQTLAALRQAGRALGITIAGAVKLLDIGCVVLGGIYAPLGPWIQPEVQREVDLRVLSSSWSPVRVRISLAGTDASVLGAASSVIRAIIDDPSTWLRRWKSSIDGNRS
ncbi:ROK family protein [Streptomyces yanii]|uniref:ROK family protein n=1 Tax=Streptomyces yanii TaxID=78510 RepID=UPI003CD07FD5